MPKNYQKSFCENLKNKLGDELPYHINVRSLGYEVTISVGNTHIYGQPKPTTHQALQSAFQRAYTQTKGMSSDDLRMYLQIENCEDDEENTKSTTTGETQGQDEMGGNAAPTSSEDSRLAAMLERQFEKS